MKENISELVWLYIKQRPFLKEIIRQGITNYSALARKIASDIFEDEKHENAIKMALIRLVKKIRKTEENMEGNIIKILKNSSLSLRSKIAIIISTRKIDNIKYISYVESKGMITYITEEKELEKIKKSRSIVSVQPNLNLIAIHSPIALEQTPGVMAHILNLLASEGINIIELISCYTDTVIIIKKTDTKRVYTILEDLVG